MSDTTPRSQSFVVAWKVLVPFTETGNKEIGAYRGDENLGFRHTLFNGLARYWVANERYLEMPNGSPRIGGKKNF